MESMTYLKASAHFEIVDIACILIPAKNTHGKRL